MDNEKRLAQIELELQKVDVEIEEREKLTPTRVGKYIVSICNLYG